MFMALGAGILLMVVFFALNASVDYGNQSDMTAKLTMCSKEPAREFSLLYQRVLSKSEERIPDSMFPDASLYANITDPNALLASAKQRLTDNLYACLLHAGGGIDGNLAENTRIDDLFIEREMGKGALKVKLSTGHSHVGEKTSSDDSNRMRIQVSTLLTLKQPEQNEDTGGSEEYDESSSE